MQFCDAKLSFCKDKKSDRRTFAPGSAPQGSAFWSFFSQLDDEEDALRCLFSAHPDGSIAPAHQRNCEERADTHKSAHTVYIGRYMQSCKTLAEFLHTSQQNIHHNNMDIYNGKSTNSNLQPALMFVLPICNRGCTHHVHRLVRTNASLGASHARLDTTTGSSSRRAGSAILYRIRPMCPKTHLAY